MKTLALIIKGMLLYATALFCILVLSAEECDFLLYIYAGLFILSCYICIDKKTFEKLTFINWLDRITNDK